MATGSYFNSNATVGVTKADTFIPEIWSDETIAKYKLSLKMAPLVKRLPMTGKKGDVIHIPMPVRGQAFAKAETSAVTLQANVESERTITIDRHFEYSRLIDDIVDVQALSSLRKFYTDDAGYALAVQVDTDLINTATGFGNGTKDLSPGDTGAEWVNSNTFYMNGTSGLGAYAVDTVATGDNFTDKGFLEAIKILDDNDVPLDGRVLVAPPAARKSLMGLERYVSSDFRDERTVRSGLIGTVYGVDIYITTNAPLMESAAENTQDVDVRGMLFMHKDAIVLAEQMGVRSQSQYKQEYLADLFTADTIYGTQVYRPEAGLVIAIADE